MADFKAKAGKVKDKLGTCCYEENKDMITERDLSNGHKNRLVGTPTGQNMEQFDHQNKYNSKGL